jgi:hypothetical protein
VVKIFVGAVAVGASFGAATSLVNQVSSPYSALGAPLAGSVWAAVAKVLSMLFDAGWSWAALAVVMGWRARTWLRGALAGALSLMAATVAYYLTDHYVAGAGTDMVTWLAAGLLLGLVLGAIGVAVRRPGVVGLIAALTVPVGAAAQMILLPPSPTLTVTTTAVLAQAIVWIAAALGAGWALQRFRARRRAADVG